MARPIFALPAPSERASCWPRSRHPTRRRERTLHSLIKFKGGDDYHRLFAGILGVEPAIMPMPKNWFLPLEMETFLDNRLSELTHFHVAFSVEKFMRFFRVPLGNDTGGDGARLCRLLRSRGQHSPSRGELRGPLGARLGRGAESHPAISAQVWGTALVPSSKRSEQAGVLALGRLPPMPRHMGNSAPLLAHLSAPSPMWRSLPRTPAH
jgi:hypothetical protein